jgi:hypothetical protein
MKEIEDNLEEEQRTFRLIRQMQGHIFTIGMAIRKLLSTGRDIYTMLGKIQYLYTNLQGTENKRG